MATSSSRYNIFKLNFQYKMSEVGLQGEQFLAMLLETHNLIFSQRAGNQPYILHEMCMPPLLLCEVYKVCINFTMSVSFHIASVIDQAQ